MNYEDKVELAKQINLNYVWNYYFHDIEQGWSKDNPIKITKMKTIYDFWTYYNNCPKIKDIIDGSGYYLFRDDIPLENNDILNKNSGMIVVDVDDDSYFKKSCMLAFCEDNIYGVHTRYNTKLEFKIKNKTSEILFWIKELNDKNKIKLGELILKELGKKSAVFVYHQKGKGKIDINLNEEKPKIKKEQKRKNNKRRNKKWKKK